MYQYILFDLDGTLTDPGIGITNSVMHALKKFNIPLPERKELYVFIGPPLIDSFQKYYGLTHEECEKCVEYYREYFADKGIFENKVYSGIPEVLEELKKQGKTIILATSKLEHFAHQILEHFDLAKYFDFVTGASMDQSRTKKADVIAYALRENSITDTTKCIMIGDREQDILGSKACDMHSIGVLYGYGSIEELQEAGANFIAKTPAEILTCLERKEV